MLEVLNGIYSTLIVPFKRLNTDKADISFPLGKLSIPASLYDKWFKEDRIFIFNSLDNLEYLGISRILSNR